MPPVHLGHRKTAAMVCLKWHILLDCLAKNDAMDPNRYEHFLVGNWPIFEKITEKVVSAHAMEILDLGCGPGQPALLIAKTLSNARVSCRKEQKVWVIWSLVWFQRMIYLHLKLRALMQWLWTMFLCMYLTSWRPCEKSDMCFGLVAHAFVSVWRKNPFFTLTVEAYASVAGEKPEISMDPLVLAEDQTMQSLIEATRGLLVLEHQEAISYPVSIGYGRGSLRCCHGGSWLMVGKTEKRWCSWCTGTLLSGLRYKIGREWDEERTDLRGNRSRGSFANADEAGNVQCRAVVWKKNMQKR